MPRRPSEYPSPRRVDRRPPPRKLAPNYLRAPFLLGAGVALLAIAGVAILLTEPDTATRQQSATAMAQTTASSVSVPPSAIVPAGTPPGVIVTLAPAPESTPGQACLETCLVRVSAPNSADVESLLARGMQSVYQMDGQLWGTADGTLVDSLNAEGVMKAVVTADADTSALFVVRFPESIDLAMALQVGEILDQSGRSVIVRADAIPPYILELANSGIAVEKLPPAQPGAADRSALAPLESPDPLLRSVSEEEIVRIITDLQSMGATQGELGSRQHPSAGNLMAADYIFGRLASYGLTVQYNDFVADDGSYATNIVGALPGDDPSRIFLVVAHFDTRAVNGIDGPGAEDNASGVAAMIEIARVLSTYRLPYPVWFAGLTGEEQGFQGSYAFTQQAADPAIVGAFNLDAVGWPGRDHELVVNGDSTSTWLQDFMIQANDQFGFGQDLIIRQNELIVADDNIFRAAGIPTILVARALYGDSAVHHTADDILENVDVHGVNDVAGLTLMSLFLALTG